MKSRFHFVLVLLLVVSGAWGAVTSEVSRTDAVGNGATAVYSFTFPVKATSELRVFVEDADGLDDELALGVDYTATLNTSGTGSITLTAGVLASGLKLSIQRGIPYTQTYNPAAAGAYNAASLGVALDRLAHEVIRLKGDVARSVKIPYLEAGGDSVTKIPQAAADRAGQSLVFDASGNLMAGSALSGATVSAFGATLIDDASASAARATLGAERASQRINVLNYSGVDNTGVASSTVGIRLALTAAKAAGVDLYFPAGTYLMNKDSSYDETLFSLLYISTSQTGIVGDGSGSTTIKCGDAAASGINLTGASYAQVRGITIDMNNSTGYGLFVGGQYCQVSDVKIKNITGTRANDTVRANMALVIPNSTLCSFDDVTILNCSNGVYVGFPDSNPSAPAQYITFNRLNMDPSSTGFSVRVKYSTSVVFNQAYLEGAPERLIDVTSCTGTSFNDLTAEIVGDYPLTANSHILFSASSNTKVNGCRIRYAAGAPANKNIFELGGAGQLTSISNCLIQIAENIGEVVKTTATQDQVVLDGVYVLPIVGGKTSTAITTGAFYNFSARSVQGATMKPTGTHTSIVGAFCDVWVTTAGNPTHDVLVGNDWAIYADAALLTGCKHFTYVPAASNTQTQGGTTQVEISQANSYFAFGNGITHKYSTAATPESAVTATPGSLVSSNNGGGGRLWMKESGSGNTGWLLVPSQLTGSATYDPPSLVDGAGVTTTVTVTGANLGDLAHVSFGLDLQGILMTAYVSSANTVSVRFQNETTGTLDLASSTLRVRVQRQ